MDNMLEEDGKPKRLMIHHHTEVEVTVIKRYPSLEDVFSGAYEDEAINFDFDKAAKDLLDSLNGHDCVAFLEALHNVTAQEIVRQWKKYSPDRLKEEHYIKYLEYELTPEKIVDKVYMRYSIIMGMTGQVESLTKEEFIVRVKTDPEFSKKWEIGIDEKELSLEERRSSVSQEMFDQAYTGGDPSTLSHSEIDQWNIPRTKITVTHNNETYENN